MTKGMKTGAKSKASASKVVKNIRRKTRKQHSAEDLANYLPGDLETNWHKMQYIAHFLFGLVMSNKNDELLWTMNAVTEFLFDIGSFAGA